MNEVNVNRLIDLNRPKQLAFAYLACKRSYNNCTVFSSKYSLDFNSLSEGIKIIYDSIFSNSYTDHYIEAVMQQVSDVVPNTDNYTDSNATIVMYCGGIIHESLTICKRHSENYDLILKGIVSLILNAVDCFIQERDNMDYEDEFFEEKILADPVMFNEIKLQNDIISYLESIKDFDESHLQYLITMQQANILNLTLE